MVIVAGYKNRYVMTKMRHPKLDRNIQDRIAYGYVNIKVVGKCEGCGDVVTSLEERTEDEDGVWCCFCK